MGSASFNAFIEISTAVDESALQVASKGVETVSGAVGHRFGDEAGRATATGLEAVGEAALAARNIAHLGPKSLAKNAAKSAVKGAVSTAVSPDGALPVDIQKTKDEQNVSGGGDGDGRSSSEQLHLLHIEQAALKLRVDEVPAID